MIPQHFVSHTDISRCTNSQTCIKRSPLGQRKWPLKGGSIHMKSSMTGEEKGDLLIQVVA